MTNPDREELFTPDELAVRLDEWANCLDKSQMDLRSDMRCAAIHLRRLASSDGGVKASRVSVPEGQTPLDDKLGHRYLDVIKEGATSRDTGLGSPYHEHSLEHCLHAVGWVQRDLRLALDKARAAPPADAGMREALEKHNAFITSIYDSLPKTRVARDEPPATMDAALTAPGATTKSDGGDLPANLAEIIETELTAWRGVNGGVFTIHAAALGISCAIRSAVFRANNTESDGGHGGQPYASTDAVEGASAPNATSGKQEGRTGIEVGASQTPGSSMSSGQSAPIVAGQAPDPSDPSSTRSGVTVEIKHLISSARAFLAHFNPCDLAEDKSQQWQSLEHQCNRAERALLDLFDIRRK